MIQSAKATNPLLRDRITQSDFESLSRGTRGDLFRITSRLATQLITPDDWADYFDAILFNAHTQASVLGRRLAGDKWPLNDDDRARGLAAKDADADFLRNFLEDIRTGRYTDEETEELRQAQVMNRAQLYVRKIRATSAEAFVSAGEVDDEYTWKLGPNDHCADCPRIAALSPFTVDTLFTHPGEGDTACISNCTCILIRDRDGAATFDRVDF